MLCGKDAKDFCVLNALNLVPLFANIIKACYCGATFLRLQQVDDLFAQRCLFTLLQFVCFGLYSLPFSYLFIFKTPLASLPFYFALLLFVDLSIQRVYLGSEVLAHFVPLGLQRRSEQAILDSEQFSMEVDSFHLERKKHIWANCVVNDEHYLKRKNKFQIVG